MRYPGWITDQLKPKGRALQKINKTLRGLEVNTVCESARCPNRGECYANNTMTFMILGNICTRNCSFCAVEQGTPEPVNLEEIEMVVKAAGELGLQYLVVTSVTRDDLADEGSMQYVRLIKALRNSNPDIKIETLTPDYRANINNARNIFKANPDVFNHNLETIRRLYPQLRQQADYDNSLDLLQKASEAGLITKSGFMVGVGEKKSEVFTLLDDLNSNNVDIVTIGQYIAPSAKHFPVKRFVTPAEFAEYKSYGERIGIKYVFSAPLVRSSYMAQKVIEELTRNS